MDALSTIGRRDGSDAGPCRLVDVSVTGARCLTEMSFTVGDEVVIGNKEATVSRITADGVAVVFAQD